MDIWTIVLIALASVLWYSIGMWGSVIGIRRLKAGGSKIDAPLKTWGLVAALGGPVNLIIVLSTIPRSKPSGFGQGRGDAKM